MRPFDAFERWLFSPAPAFALGACRAAFCTYLLVFFSPLVDSYWNQNPAAFADVSPLFHSELRWLGLVPAPHLPASVLGALFAVFVTSLALGAIGWWTRPALAAACTSGFVVLSATHAYGKLSHTSGAVMLGLVILALSRAGDAVSLDARGRPAVADSARYGWPIRCVWILLACVYGVAGLSKLARSGLAYVDPEAMAQHLIVKQYGLHVVPPTDIGMTLAQHPALCSAMSAAVLVVELGFVFALFSSRARAFFVPAMAIAHVAIYVLLGPPFFLLLSLFLFFVPWHKLRRA